MPQLTAVEPDPIDMLHAELRAAVELEQRYLMVKQEMDMAKEAAAKAWDKAYQTMLSLYDLPKVLVRDEERENSPLMHSKFIAMLDSERRRGAPHVAGDMPVPSFRRD